MKKYLIPILFILVCFVSGCGSSRTNLDILKTCEVINSAIVDTSFSSSKEYFEITFENGLVYSEDITLGKDKPIYTIKLPKDKDFNTLEILQSIATILTEDWFSKLETEGEIELTKLGEHWFIRKSIDNNTVNYVLRRLY